MDSDPEPTLYLIVVLSSSISSEKSILMVMVSPCFAYAVLLLLVVNVGLVTVGAVSSIPVILAEPKYLIREVGLRHFETEVFIVIRFIGHRHRTCVACRGTRSCHLSHSW